MPSLREYTEAQWKAHHREHAKDDRALQLAATLAAENKASSNEWRQAMTDRERTFFTKAEATGYDTRLDQLEKADIARTTRETERERSFVRTLTVAGIVITIASVVINLLIRLAFG